MGKTYGHTRDIKTNSGRKYGPGAGWMLKENRSKPYLADKDLGLLKEHPDMGNGTGVSKLGKLVAKNANRARKKAMRQQSKRMILNEMD